METTAEIIHVINLNSDEVVYSNRSLLEDLGYTFDEIQKYDLTSTQEQRCHPDDLQRLQEYKRNLSKTPDDATGSI